MRISDQAVSVSRASSRRTQGSRNASLTKSLRLCA